MWTHNLDKKKSVDMNEMTEQEADGTETPGEFLVNLGQALRERDDVDAGLAEIISTHLLTAKPTPDAVSQAKAAILKLARDRAARPGSEENNG